MPTQTASQSSYVLGLHERLRHSSHHYIHVAGADIDGVLRGKHLAREKVLKTLSSGLGFCNVVFGWDMHDRCYERGGYTSNDTGYPDALFRVDPASCREVPWNQYSLLLLGDFWENEQQPLEICPRQLLKQVLARMAESGLRAECAFEFEWLNFAETPESAAEAPPSTLHPLEPGMFGYSVLRPSLHGEYYQALLDGLREFRVPLEGLHPESGPGIYEAAIQHCDALEAADRAILFKTAVKQIGYRHGVLPCFMARWSNELPGNGGHIHQSIWRDEENVLTDKTLDNYLSGLLHCMPEILPLYAPTVNSYKRLVEGFWAPTRANWGYENRTTALRVVGAESTSPRIETRIAGADINPYLALAATLASGHYGIQNELPLTQAAVEGSGYAQEEAQRLPTTLFEATQRMDRSELARKLFGDTFVDHFVKTRYWEWDQAQEQVTDWERSRYLELV